MKVTFQMTADSVDRSYPVGGVMELTSYENGDHIVILKMPDGKEWMVFARELHAAIESYQKTINNAKS